MSLAFCCYCWIREKKDNFYLDRIFFLAEVNHFDSCKMDNEDVEIELQEVDDDFADAIPTKDQNMEEGELSDDNNESSVSSPKN